MAKENPLYTYETVVLDLSIVRTGVRYQFSGNFIKAIESSDIEANIDIAFNSSGNDTVNIKKGRAIRAHVLEWYITNTAQAGKTITLLIATEDSLRIFDDGVVADIDTIQELIEPVAVNYLPDKIISDQGLVETTARVLTTTNVAAADTVIYTVPANKIFYLAYLSLISSGFAAAQSVREWQHWNSAPAFVHYLADGSVAWGTSSNIFSDRYTFKPFWKLTAGETIRLYNVATCGNAVYGQVVGYLKDA